MTSHPLLRDTLAIFIFFVVIASTATASTYATPVSRSDSPWQSASLQFDNSIVASAQDLKLRRKNPFGLVSTFPLALAERKVSSVSPPPLSRISNAASSVHRVRGGGDASPEEFRDNDPPSATPVGASLPYKLGIRDSIMIAHSFHGHPSFGPAGGLHGATYTVDVEFASSELHPECNWVIDIGAASDILARVLKKYNYQNLDEVFGKGVMTTTEFMCRTIFEDLAKILKQETGVSFEGQIKVTLWESHKAWASYNGHITV